MEKMPPKEKVIEAWTAIVDGRVEVDGESAIVKSSDDTKEYVVRFKGDLYSSNDNATFWRGYAGYPVIAVLMLQGRLPFDRTEAEKWKGVNWKSVNTKYRNDYAKAVEEVAKERDIDAGATEAAVNAVMDKLKELHIAIKRKI